MKFSFQRYLLAKQSVDDRALNRYVYETMLASLPAQPIRIIEIGAGVGTMLVRLLRWGTFQKADYVLVDKMAENLDYASEWIPRWGAEAGLGVERSGRNQLRVFDGSRDIRITLEQANVFHFVQEKPTPADLLIAHAFLDLLPPDALPKLLPLTRNLTWLTINFDGVTTFEPTLDPALDQRIERLYHQTMDSRPTGGDSQSGRHLFTHLRALGAELLAAGASDWVVYAQNGKYPADEAYFLNYILHFFEEALAGQVDLEDWLARRRAQIERGELVYIAHQMDFLVRS
jgi:hypothetical protein